MNIRQAIEKYTNNIVTPAVIRVIEQKVKELISNVTNFENYLFDIYGKNYSFEYLIYVYLEGSYKYEYELKLISYEDAFMYIDKTDTTYKDYIYFEYNKYHEDVYGTIGIPVEFFLLDKTDLYKKLLSMKITQFEESKQNAVNKMLEYARKIESNQNDITICNDALDNLKKE